MIKQCVGQDIKDDSSDGVEGGKGKPEDAEQVKVRLNAAGTLLQCRHWSDDLLSTLAAECLSRLHRGAACIAKHFVPPPRKSLLVLFFFATTHRLTDSTQSARKSSAEVLDVSAKYYLRAVVCR
jgi:hypothetical protein